MVAARWIIERHRGDRIPVHHDKSASGKALADVVRSAPTEHGLAPMLYKAIYAGEHDYSVLDALLKRNAVDLVYFGGDHTEAGLIVRQMRQAGLKAGLMACDGLANEQFWAITGGEGLALDLRA